MMKKFSAKIIFAFILLAMPALSFAQYSDSVPNPSYLFHLYYDRGQLFADRDFEFAYDIIPEVYSQIPPLSSAPYRIEIIDFLGRVAFSYPFDATDGTPGFVSGKIKVKAPYVSDGQRAVFYDSQGTIKLSIDISETSYCNDDSVCDFEKGENQLTCPYDCSAAATPPPGSSASESDSTGLIIVIVLLSGMAASMGWYFWTRYQAKKNQNLPTP